MLGVNLPPGRMSGVSTIIKLSTDVKHYIETKAGNFNIKFLEIHSNDNETEDLSKFTFKVVMTTFSGSITKTETREFEFKVATRDEAVSLLVAELENLKKLDVKIQPDIEEVEQKPKH